MRRLLSVCLLFCYFQTSAQTPLENITKLKEVLATNPSDSIKIKTYSDLCYYYGAENKDSSAFYGNMALQLSKRNNNLYGQGQAYNDLGILFYKTANFSKSITYYKKSLQIREELQDTMGIGGLHNKLGIAYQRVFDMDSALYHNIKALEIFKKKNNTAYVALIRNNIANIYFNLKLYDKALKEHLDIVDIRKELGDTLGLVYSYSNIGNTYLFLNDTLNSLAYYEKGIHLARLKNSSSELATLLNNYGTIFKDKKNYNKAKTYFEESYSIRKKLNDEFGVASVLLNLGELKLKIRNYNEAGTDLREGLQIAKRINAKEKIMNAYAFLLEYHAYKKNTDSILHYQFLTQKMQDSILSSRVTQEIAELQEKYNKTERENQILSQRTQIAEKELALNRKNTQLIGLTLVSILLIILGYLLYNQQKLKNRQLLKEGELREALVKIETQNQLQEQRLKISRDLHDNIGAQLTFIISSIENLQFGFKLNNDKLTDKLKGISAFTKETIYELRDTIWAMNKNDISIEDLKVRISNFVDKANLHSDNISFNFNIDNSISETLSFSSVEGMNIYRIIQEAINNAIKYAQPKNIAVSMLKKEDHIITIITDDGNGFDIEKVKKGNGLNNLKKRAEEINAALDIASEIGKGTTVKLIA